MAWTDPQCRELFRAFWTNGGATCPVCTRTPVRFQYHPFIGGYILTANCPRGCGSLQMQNALDPDAAAFRDWTDTEVEEIIDNHFTQQRTACGSCGSEVHVNEQPYFGGMLLSMMCRRCGNRRQRDFPRQ